jgi:hypothetical protein
MKRSTKNCTWPQRSQGRFGIFYVSDPWNAVEDREQKTQLLQYLAWQIQRETRLQFRQRSKGTIFIMTILNNAQ